MGDARRMDALKSCSSAERIILVSYKKGIFGIWIFKLRKVSCYPSMMMYFCCTMLCWLLLCRAKGRLCALVVALNEQFCPLCDLEKGMCMGRYRVG